MDRLTYLALDQLTQYTKKLVLCFAATLEHLVLNVREKGWRKWHKFDGKLPKLKQITLVYTAGFQYLATENSAQFMRQKYPHASTKVIFVERFQDYLTEYLKPHCTKSEPTTWNF